MTFELQKQIREMYRDWIPRIKEHYPRFDVYGGNWTSLIPFTPIENNVWHDIRVVDVPFVPQFPVLEYFIDFADPIKKIGIEVDGEKWHKDKEKDTKRQKRIEKEGWIIYRILGKQTFHDISYYLKMMEKHCSCYYRENNEECRTCQMFKYEFENYCSEGILRKIKQEHYPVKYLQ